MRNILIIGGSSSIGDNIEDAFIQNGDKVFSTYFSSPKKEKVQNITSIKLDLSSPNSYSPLLDLVKDNALDAVIILSGILPGRSIEKYSHDRIEKVMSVNFTSNAYIIKALLPYLKKNSNIVIMSSISGFRGSFDPIYAAAKAAQIGLVKSLALWNQDKYKINAVAPSLINESSMFYGMSKERREFHEANSPTKQLITKTEISKLVFDICQPNSKFANGEIIEIEGSSA